MGLSPELTLLIVNAVFLGFAYFWVYPGLPDKRIPQILLYDLAITAAALTVAAFLYAGTGLSFQLLFIPKPWWAFSFLTFVLMEFPLWEWFRRKHGISYGEDGPSDEDN